MHYNCLGGTNLSFWEALIFGLVQGITEFLPISSTAHIIVTQRLLGYEFPGLTFEVVLHLASVLAVIIYFRKDLYEILLGFFRYIGKRQSEDRLQFLFALYIVIATAITGGLGLIIQDWIGDAMKSSLSIAIALAITGVFLIFIEKFKQYGERQVKDMKWSDSVVVGLVQTLAVLPGISRSGSTLIAALWLGLDRPTAIRYSFLLSIPVVLGSSVLVVTDLNNDMWATIGWLPLLVAFVSTFIFSIVGIVWLINFLKKSKLIYFAIYCFIAAIFIYWFIEPSIVAMN